MRTFYELDSGAQSILDMADQAVQQVIGPDAAAVDREGRFPRRGLDALAKAGLLGLTVPKKHGGLAASPRTFAAVAETIARACPSTGMVFVMHVCATNVVAAHPPEEDGEKLLGAIARGEHLTTLAFSEKGSRSHFWAPVSKAATRDGKHVLSAEKSWVTSAGEADGYVVSTLAPDAQTAMETSLYYVRKGARGLAVAGAWDGLGMRGNGSSPVSLKDVVASPADLVSAPGKGFDAMMGVVLPWFAVGTAAISCGLAEGALAATAGHLGAARFEHLGQPLSSLPNLRANVARMRIEIDRSRAQLAYTARALETPGAHTMPAVLSVKAQAGEMALIVTDLAMKSCGGAAFSKHLPVERLFRDARAATVMAPTTEALHDFLGKAVLGLPLFA